MGIGQDEPEKDFPYEIVPEEIEELQGQEGEEHLVLHPPEHP